MTKNNSKNKWKEWAICQFNTLTSTNEMKEGAVRQVSKSQAIKQFVLQENAPELCSEVVPKNGVKEKP